MAWRKGNNIYINSDNISNISFEVSVQFGKGNCCNNFPMKDYITIVCFLVSLVSSYFICRFNREFSKYYFIQQLLRDVLEILKTNIWVNTAAFILVLVMIILKYYINIAIMDVSYFSFGIGLSASNLAILVTMVELLRYRIENLREKRCKKSSWIFVSVNLVVIVTTLVTYEVKTRTISLCLRYGIVILPLVLVNYTAAFWSSKCLSDILHIVTFYLLIQRSNSGRASNMVNTINPSSEAPIAVVHDKDKKEIKIELKDRSTENVIKLPKASPKGKISQLVLIFLILVLMWSFCYIEISSAFDKIGLGNCFEMTQLILPSILSFLAPWVVLSVLDL